MSHSHETVSPVKRAPAEALRKPRRVQHPSGCRTQGCDVIEALTIRRWEEGGKTTGWVRLRDIVVNQRRDRTFPTEKHRHQVTPHRAWPNEREVGNKS